MPSRITRHLYWPCRLPLPEHQGHRFRLKRTKEVNVPAGLMLRKRRNAFGMLSIIRLERLVNGSRGLGVGHD